MSTMEVNNFIFPSREFFSDKIEEVLEFVVADGLIVGGCKSHKESREGFGRDEVAENGVKV